MRVYNVSEFSESVSVTAVMHERAPTSRRAASFVVIFLMVAFMVLSVYRYGIGTLAMDWYLFQIARQTAWLVDKTGATAWVEHASELHDREDEVRAVLGLDDDVPLTSWHAWRFRAVTGRHDLRRFLSLGAALESFHADGSSLTRPTLSERVERLGSLARRLASRGGSSSALQKILQETAQLEAALTAPAAAMVSHETQRAVELRLQEIYSALQAESTFRIVKMQNLTRDMGPRVHCVARDASDTSAEGSFVFQIAADCGGVPPMAIFLSAVVAFPTTWRRRSIGLGFGIPLLHMVNIVRLACLGRIGMWLGAGEGFEFAHAYVWQGLYIALVVAAWLWWVHVVVQGRCSWIGNQP